MLPMHPNRWRRWSVPLRPASRAQAPSRRLGANSSRVVHVVESVRHPRFDVVRWVLERVVRFEEPARFGEVGKSIAWTKCCACCSMFRKACVSAQDICIFQRTTLASSLRTCTLIEPPTATTASARTCQASARISLIGMGLIK